MASPIIDIHPHIGSNDTVRYPITPIGGKRSDWSHERAMEADEMIAEMKKAGVAKSAMVHSSTTYGFNCEYVADTVAAHPDYFTGVFSVNVLEPDGPKMMRHWFSRGCTGMRIFSRGSTMAEPWLKLDDERIFPCYETAAELNIPVATNAKVESFGEIEAMLKRYPKVNFIIEHGGKTDFNPANDYAAAAPLWKLASYPNFYMKITPMVYTTKRSLEETRALFTKLFAVLGPQRLAWGSNFPASEGTLTEILNGMKNAVAHLPQSDQDWILGKTALSLYPVLAK